MASEDQPRGSSARYRVNADRQAAYTVAIVPDIGDGFAPDPALPTLPAKGLLVTTPTVASLYAAKVRRALLDGGCETALLVLYVDETTKSMASVLEVCAAASSHNLGRDEVMIALGGGVCMDIVAMAASLFRRGIAHLRIPTTLVGQVDAGIGVKGGVNFVAKNQVGCFHPPLAVVIDPHFLATLPVRHIRNGLAEIVKIAAVRSPALFGAVEEGWPGLVSLDLPRALPIIRDAVAELLDALAGNLFEDRGYERLADFGHSFSPAIESASFYRVAHGEAVAIDMALSTMIARRMGMIGAAPAERILGLIEAIGLDLSSEHLTADLCRAALEKAAAHRAGRMNLVVPTGIGEAAFLRDRTELPNDVVEGALADLAWRAQGPAAPLPLAGAALAC